MRRGLLYGSFSRCIRILLKASVIILRTLERLNADVGDGCWTVSGTFASLS